MLAQVVRCYVPPLQAGPVVAACISVPATAADLETFTDVLTAATKPRSITLIDSVRAAAIDAGALAGTTLVLDVGAQLTELAVLSEAGVVIARRAEVGTEDLGRPAGPDTIIAVAATILDDMQRHAPERRLGRCAPRWHPSGRRRRAATRSGAGPCRDAGRSRIPVLPATSGGRSRHGSRSAGGAAWPGDIRRRDVTTTACLLRCGTQEPAGRWPSRPGTPARTGWGPVG
jgi:hypothetical protein